MQLVKPRCRVEHVPPTPWNPTGRYYVVYGLGLANGCACINRALRTWYESAQILQTLPRNLRQA